MKKELLADTCGLLARAGFYISEICTLRPSSFDFVARRDDMLLLVKVLNNIDALSEDVAQELLFLAEYLEGIPLLVGNRTSAGLLEDETLYYRYNVPIITVTTLADVLQGIPPLVSAAPGGFYANLDGTKIRELRKRKDISIGQLARAVGVSRRTIRMYEQGERATIEVAEKISAFLGDEILRPLELLDFMRHTGPMPEGAIQDHMLSLLSSLEMTIFPTFRSPFHALSQALDECLLVGINDRRIAERARIMANVSRVMEKHSVFFVEKTTQRSISGVPVIGKKDISRLDSAHGLLDLIREREQL